MPVHESLRDAAADQQKGESLTDDTDLHIVVRPVVDEAPEAALVLERTEVHAQRRTAVHRGYPSRNIHRHCHMNQHCIIARTLHIHNLRCTHAADWKLT